MEPQNLSMTPSITELTQGKFFYDASHWGRLQIFGSDRLRFLHNQSSNNIQALKPGQGCETVFLTSTARTLDLATVWIHDDHMDVLVSPQRREFLLQWLDKYIFFGDAVELKDVSERTTTLVLIGAGWQLWGEQWGIPLTQTLHSHRMIDPPANFDYAALGTGLGLPGYTLTGDRSAPDLRSSLLADGGQALDPQDWARIRILQGRPMPDAELTEDYNPLEARLLHTISFDKGCYIGQETIARLNTYQGVKQELWGLELSSPVPPGTPLTLGGQTVGRLTSCIALPKGAFGLGYIRKKAGGQGLRLEATTPAGLPIEAHVVDVPFLQ